MSRRYYFDLHVHSTDASDDAGATVEGYLKWITALRRKGFVVDGIVLTEHRNYEEDPDYTELSDRYGIYVLKGAELETEVGHVLTYGIREPLKRNFDFSRVDLPSAQLFPAASDLGGYAVGAHAGRPRIGIRDYDQRGHALEHVHTIEALNGGSSVEENRIAQEIASRRALRTVGGSDAHYVSSIARCLTAFTYPITHMAELVEQLHAGEYEPVTIEQTFQGVE